MNEQDELKILWAARLGLNTSEVVDGMELSEEETTRLRQVVESKLIDVTIKAAQA